MFNLLIFLAFLCGEQPPSGGCVLKHVFEGFEKCEDWQPPSGGCVLKQQQLSNFVKTETAATFGWLCVETNQKQDQR